MSSYKKIETIGEPRVMVIGISGKKQAGKDYTFRVLFNSGFNVERVAFADALKRGAEAILEPVLKERYNADALSQELLENAKNDNKDLFDLPNTTYRKFLQALGSGLRDHFNQDVWILLVRETILSNMKKGKITVITDVRSKNEFAFVKSLGGHMLRVNRVGQTSNDNHPSETDLDDATFDKVLLNSGDRRYDELVLNHFLSVPNLGYEGQACKRRGRNLIKR